MEQSGAIMLQRMVYTLIKFQGPWSIVNTAFHQRLTGLQPLNHVILTTKFTNQNNWRRDYNYNQYQNISCLRAYSTYLKLSNIYFYFYSTIYIYIYIKSINSFSTVSLVQCSFCHLLKFGLVLLLTFIEKKNSVVCLNQNLQQITTLDFVV